MTLPGSLFSTSLFGPLVAAGCGVGLLALPDGLAFGWPLVCLGSLAMVLGRVTGLPMPGIPVTLCLLFGFCYGCWQISAVLAQRLPLCADEGIRRVELTVLDRPVLTPMGDGRHRWVARFQGAVDVSAADDCLSAGTYRVRLSWYDPPDLGRGERWAVEARLRPPWGNHNPGGFDYERWLLGERLAGTGYVRKGRRLQAAPIRVDLRSRVRDSLRRWLEGRRSDHAGIMLALMTGDDTGLSQAEWRHLRDSGTVHLLVVSGLHVGMVSGCLFLLGRLLARLSTPGMLWLGARRLAGLVALTGSGAYVWLSGMGVPALRAWLMSALVLLLVCSGRAIRGLSVVLFVMAFLLLVNPLVVHQQGFWLSFAAVLALVAWFEPALVHDPPGPVSPARRMGSVLIVFAQVQIVLMFALSPLLAAFQGGIPLQSPLINALVVPLVTLLVLPLLLIAALFHLPAPGLADGLLTVAEASLDLVMYLVTTAASVPTTPVSVGGPGAWCLMLLVLFILWQRPSWPVRLLSVGLWWALLLPDVRMPLVNEFRITALDVGQGSALLIDTRQHRLIFDAGPRYASGFDLGDAVVVPSFRQLGNGELNTLVISHDDVDHAGGSRAVLAQLQPEEVYSSFPLSGESTGSTSAIPCTRDTTWQWDGVKFQFLHPEPDWRGSDNDRSCVLLITNGRRSALLAGDISRRVERRLPKQPVNLLMAPHHGSRTSSSPGFVQGFMPDTVLISTDRRSRYGHPHPEVLARYAGARIRITGRSGALTWHSAVPDSVMGHRATAGAYWHRPGASLCRGDSVGSATDCRADE